MDKSHILNFFRAHDGFAAIITGNDKRRLTLNHILLYFPNNSAGRPRSGDFEAKN